ncbi:hypothetical protein B0G76_2633 [Paraburkholderia sp. BL23I1N1]|uniref:DUF4148 domain-containing protein n=1 Tax=Paraburkholderia sp. BL23I1N1 TaxID=1938802 RepID=UPI000E745AC9|nr:DUF4148 domain-containing protein [Paraburkholderia sp. BL23I1N1]RKE36447.1 hypothetical protein B0G76_2633 [Paraburkholderia sp. BL23I1N1]
MHSVKQMMILFALASLGVGAVTPASAQNAEASGTNGTAAAKAAASATQPTKAQRKQARKEARAKKNAELKKLEDSGYQPYRSDPDYPQNLQNAQKKAGIGQGASQ